jgi:hypothetical protein
MIRHGVSLTSAIERLDAQIRRWPARWLLRYLILLSALAVAACIATVARADTTFPTQADVRPAQDRVVCPEPPLGNLPSLGDSAAGDRHRTFALLRSL